MYLTYNRDYESRLVRALFRATERKMRRWDRYMKSSCTYHDQQGCPVTRLGVLFSEAQELCYTLRDHYVDYTSEGE